MEHVTIASFKREALPVTIGHTVDGLIGLNSPDVLNIIKVAREGTNAFGSPRVIEDALEFAGFVVRACNTHEALLDALLIALPYVEDVLANREQLACFKPGVVEAHRKQIWAALSKAGKR